MAYHKISHPTREMADAHRRGMLAITTEHPKRQAALETYWCTVCDAFHVGHRRSPIALARVRARGARLKRH